MRSRPPRDVRPATRKRSPSRERVDPSLALEEIRGAVAVSSRRTAIVAPSVRRGAPRVMSAEEIELYGRELLRRAPVDLGANTRRWSYRQMAIVLHRDFGVPLSVARLRQVLTERLGHEHTPLHNVRAIPDLEISALLHRIAREPRGGRAFGFAQREWTLERIAAVVQKKLGRRYGSSYMSALLRHFLGPDWRDTFAVPVIVPNGHQLPAGWLEDLRRMLVRDKQSGVRTQ